MSRLDPARAMVFAYADPPYPGKAGYYVERQEVDHGALIAGLEAGFPDGWALSTSVAALKVVLAMCPASTRVCAWRRRVRTSRSRRALSAWEPLLVVGGRPLSTAAPQTTLDDLQTPDVVVGEALAHDVLDYRGRYDAFPRALVGMKPPEFAVWMFGQLGAVPGDELVDLYPGSGAVGRAWELYASGLEDSDRAGTRPGDISGTRPGDPRPAGRDACGSGATGPVRGEAV